MSIMAARIIASIPSTPSVKITSASRLLLRVIPSERPAQWKNFRVGAAALAASSGMRSERPRVQCPSTIMQRRALSSKTEEAKTEELPPLEYDDGWIKETLNSARTIAMVGASSNWVRPSFFAMKYLQGKGYRVIPINPGSAGKQILGEKCYASLTEMHADGIEVDMVDCFQKAERIPMITDEAIKIGAKILWMQLGVRNAEAAATAEAAGMRVVQDRCPKIEFSRLYGEIGWHGINSNVISSKRSKSGDSSGKAMKGDDGESLPEIQFRGFETRAIHAGASPDGSTGARSTPIFQTTSYVFEDADHAASLFNLQTFGNIYSRLSNPTVSVLEERIANLEGGRGATCAASGHAAQLLTLFAIMGPGDAIVASNKLYGGSITQLGKTIQRFGWRCIFVDADDIESVRKAMQEPRVKGLWVESLANPGGIVSDLRALAEVTRGVGVPLIVDNTMATPYLCRPIEHGADLVVHSTTKFLSGHGNAMGGCVVDSGKFDWSKNDKFPALALPEPAYHGLAFQETFGDLAFTIYGHAVGLRDLGPTMAPMNAFLTICGVETLAVRMRQHCANGRKVAEFLSQHPRVAWVSYATLPGNKYKALADKYLQGEGGSVFTFGVKGGYSEGIKVVERCQLISHLANLGDLRSLILHPASTTHRQLTPEQREAAGAGDDVIRLSVGLETAEDIIADLNRALNSTSGI